MLNSKYNRFKFERLPSSGGIAPVNSLPLRYNRSKFKRLPSSGGIVPVNLLKSRRNRFKFERLASSTGIVPVNSLPLRSNRSKFKRLPSSGGIAPVNLLNSKYNRFKFKRLPSSGGIVPVNSLPLRSNRSKFERLPSSAGIVPVNHSCERSSPQIRSGVPSMMTPSHSAIGVSAAQFSVALPARVSRAASRASQSAIRPASVTSDTVPMSFPALTIQKGSPRSLRSLYFTLRNVEGTRPLNRFSERRNTSSFKRLPSSVGIVPVNLLS